MKLVDIIKKDKTEKPVDKLEYLKDTTINFIRQPILGQRFMYVDADNKIYRTDIVTSFNYDTNFLIIETENEAYVFIGGEIDVKDKE